jgi:WD40 repeat protein
MAALDPSGRRFAVVESGGNGDAVMVYDANTLAPSASLPVGGGARIDSLSWKSKGESLLFRNSCENEVLVYSVDSGVVRSVRKVSKEQGILVPLGWVGDSMAITTMKEDARRRWSYEFVLLDQELRTKRVTFHPNGSIYEIDGGKKVVVEVGY